MVVLITGTSSGIGRALARGYLAHGHRVYGISRNHNEELEKSASYHFLQQDISRFDTLGPGLAHLLQGVEEIGLVVLNAGILPPVGDMRETSLEEIKKVMDVNVWANKVILDTMFEKSISVLQVIAISSGAAVHGSRGWNAYALSKAALNMLICLYAKEQKDTHFTALAPGIINTAMQEYLRGLTSTEKFPVVKKLREIFEKSQMPGPEESAARLMNAFEEVRGLESGTFTDVRDLESGK